MSGISSDVSGAPIYDPASSTVEVGGTQVQDISACVITLPMLMLLSMKDIEVYGQLAKSADPLIVCEELLPKRALMGDPLNPSLAGPAIVFQQDPADADKVVVSIPNSFNATENGDFAMNFNSVLLKSVKLSSLDVNTYLWWNEAGKSLTTDPNWANKDSVLYRYGSFGKFVLAKVAYDVFGHPLAQAGIANDRVVEEELFSATAPNGSIGRRLAEAFRNLTPPQLQSIYEQLLAQDPSRFNLEDASGGAIDSSGSTTQTFPRALPFADNDIIRFEIILDDYTVKRVALNTVTGNQVTSASTAVIESDFSAQSANSGGVLSTRYAGLKLTVEVKIVDIPPSAEKLAAAAALAEAEALFPVLWNESTAAEAAMNLAANELTAKIAERDSADPSLYDSYEAEINNLTNIYTAAIAEYEVKAQALSAQIGVINYTRGLYVSIPV